MYFSHACVFVQTAFFVIPFFISYFLMPSKEITIVIQFMLLGIYIYVFGPFRGHFNPELGTKRVCAYEKIKDFVLISKTVSH